MDSSQIHNSIPSTDSSQIQPSIHNSIPSTDSSQIQPSIPSTDSSQIQPSIPSMDSSQIQPSIHNSIPSMDSSQIQPSIHNYIPTMDPSQIQPPSTSIISIQISIQNLIKSCKRRQKWEFFSGSTKQTSNTKPPWRTHLTTFLESTPVHIIAIILLLIDLAMVVLELSKTLVSCPKSTRINKNVDLWYHWVGIGILTILVTKIVALAVGSGSSFFKRPGLVADGVVLIGALLSEVLLERIGVGLIVVVSLWRVLRVVESAFELSDEAIQVQITTIFCQLELIQEENEKLIGIIAEKNTIIEELQEQLDQRH